MDHSWRLQSVMLKVRMFTGEKTRLVLKWGSSIWESFHSIFIFENSSSLRNFFVAVNGRVSFFHLFHFETGNLFDCTLFIVKGKSMMEVVGLRVSETSVVSACCFQMNWNFTRRNWAGCQYPKKPRQPEYFTGVCWEEFSCQCPVLLSRVMK